jgi:hypothetical protein
MVGSLRVLAARSDVSKPSVCVPAVWPGNGVDYVHRLDLVVDAQRAADGSISIAPAAAMRAWAAVLALTKRSPTL